MSPLHDPLLQQKTVYCVSRTISAAKNREQPQQRLVQQDNARLYIAKNGQILFSTEQIQLFLCLPIQKLDLLLNMCGIFFGLHLACNLTPHPPPTPTANVWPQIEVISNVHPQVHI